jgi:hypothetical protein
MNIDIGTVRITRAEARAIVEILSTLIERAA